MMHNFHSSLFFSFCPVESGQVSKHTEMPCGTIQIFPQPNIWFGAPRHRSGDAWLEHTSLVGEFDLCSSQVRLAPPH